MESNIYLFTGDSYMVKQSVIMLRQSLNIQHEQLNLTTFKEMPDADTLIGACAEVPFMADQRVIIVYDSKVLTAKGNATEGKKIAAFLDRLPDSTVLIFCLSDSPDKRRVLYKHIKKLGKIKELAEPKPDVCIRFVLDRVKQHGASIQKNTAAQLVQIVGCDYFALDNEAAKLAIYSDGKQITTEHVTKCVSKSLEYNVFEIHELFVKQQAGKAHALLSDILNNERPEALIGLFARKIRDMYKTRAMLDARFSMDRIIGMLKVPGFVARRLAEECRHFSAGELREGLKILSDLDYSIKSGTADASLALPDTLIKIYKL